MPAYRGVQSTRDAAGAMYATGRGGDVHAAGDVGHRLPVALEPWHQIAIHSLL